MLLKYFIFSNTRGLYKLLFVSKFDEFEVLRNIHTDARFPGLKNPQGTKHLLGIQNYLINMLESFFKITYKHAHVNKLKNQNDHLYYRFIIKFKNNILSNLFVY